jgi:hypothetical protein
LKLALEFDQEIAGINDQVRPGPCCQYKQEHRHECHQINQVDSLVGLLLEKEVGKNPDQVNGEI